MVSKLVGLLLMVVGLVEGQTQGQNSVYTTLFVNSAGSPISANVLNIGQVSHLVNVHYSDNGVSTCGTALSVVNTPIGQLEFSFDNVNFFPFGQPLTNVNSSTGSINILNETYVATGGYPFVRFHVRTMNGNCVATANYTGSIYGVNTKQTDCNGSVVGLINGVNGLGAILLNANAFANIKVCSVVISTNSTTNAPVSLFQQVNGAACNSAVLPGLTGTLTINPNNPTITIGAGVGLMFSLNPGFDLCATQGAVSVGAVTTFIVSYVIS